MATPALITVKRTYFRADGTPAEGQAVFRLPGALQHEASDAAVVADELSAEIADGVLEIEVPSTTDPAWSPDDWQYDVVITLDGVRTRGALSVPHDAPDGEMLMPVLDPAPAGSGELYAGVNHTHAGYVLATALADTLLDYVDTAGLSAVLQDYVTQAALSGQDLVSYETLLEHLADYLPKIAPKVVDSTFTVERSDGGAGRWRTDGDALDVEFVGDVIESRRQNQDFSGAQTNYRRLHGGGQTLVGKTWFGSGPYAEEQYVDAVNGLALLGGKAGAAVPEGGFRNGFGPPTAGTWDVGETVQALDGRYRCTTAGTPGTWQIVGPHRPGSMRAASYYAPIFTTFAPPTIALNEIRHVPIDIHSACTITELAVEATANVAGGLVRILLSKAGSNGRPAGNYLYVSGQLNAAATGKVGTGAINVSVPSAGRYFVAALPQGVLPTLRSIAQVPAMYEQANMATYNRCCYSEYGVTGAPAAVGGISVDAGDAPRVQMLIG